MAQSSLGDLYQHGLGVSQDFAQALHWYKMAAEQGESTAQNQLGRMYNLGIGVTKDYAQSGKWHRLSALQGNPTAQKWLGIRYEFGQGVLENHVTAHMWYNIASANGSDNSIQLKRRLVEKMTNSSIAEAQSMASKCMKSGYQDCGW